MGQEKMKLGKEGNWETGNRRPETGKSKGGRRKAEGAGGKAETWEIGEAEGAEKAEG
jgi:hypothetical protein